MATSATKIVLKETTKMTLHERFSLYRQNTQLGIGVNPATSRQAMLMNHQASVKNQRLAVQMANRPSVVAALKLKKKSLKQRLGQNQGGYLMNQRFQQSNIKSRLSLGFRQRFNGGMNARNLMNPGIIRPGTSPMIKARLGMSQNHAMMFAGSRGGFLQPRLRRNFRKGRNRNAVRHQLIQQSLSQNRGILFSNRINKASFRAKQQRGRGRGRGGGGGRNRMGRDAKVPTKQDLDNDLDQYMSQVKSNLDAELESYMSQATSMT